MNAREYRRAQDRSLAPLLRKIRELLIAYGVPATDEQREELALLLMRAVRNAYGRNYEVAQMYITAQVGLVDVPDLPDLPLRAVVEALRRVTDGLVVHGDPVSERNRTSPVVVDKVRKGAAGQIARLAQEPARNTVQKLAERTGSLGWARMLVGPASCSFCAMLASRGPVYSSEEAAIGRGGNPLDRYHSPYIDKNGNLVGGDCDCIAALVPGPVWEGRDSHEKLELLWIAASTKRGSTRKAFRRQWDSKVRSGETREFIADSVK